MNWKEFPELDRSRWLDLNLETEMPRKMNRFKFRQAYFPIFGLIPLLLLAGFGGCKISGYCLPRETPSSPVASEFQDSNSIYVSNTSPTPHCWWTAFNDPQLNQLIQLTQDQNLSLKTSLARIDEALHLSNAAALQKTQLRKPADTLPGTSIACLADSQLREREASHLHAVNELISTAVELYLNIRATDERLRLAYKNVALQEQNLELANAKLEQGRTSKFDIVMVSSQLETIRSAVPQLEIARRKYSNALCVIAGELPGGLDYLIDPPSFLPQLFDPITAGSPHALLENRADLKAAVVRYQATHCKNTDPDRLTKLLMRFNPELLQQTEQARQAKTKQALFDYQNKTLLAFREVDDSIIEFIKKNEQLEIENRIVSANWDAVQLAEAAFEAERIDFTKVLGLQTKWILSKDKIVETQRDIALAFAKANQALGYANGGNCENCENCENCACEGERLNGHQFEEAPHQTELVDATKTNVEADILPFEKSEPIAPSILRNGERAGQVQSTLKTDRDATVPASFTERPTASLTERIMVSRATKRAGIVRR